MLALLTAATAAAADVLGSTPIEWESWDRAFRDETHDKNAPLGQLQLEFEHNRPPRGTGDDATGFD